jgi:hypothetical protein
MISKLNDNLIVRLTDYETNEPSFSFLGTNEPERTARELINFAEKFGISPILRFIPEESVAGLKNSNLLVEEDKDNFDYIFSVPKLAELQGIKFKEKRNSVNKFLREHPNATFELKELSSLAVREQILSVLRRWKNKKSLDNKPFDFKNEELAIDRLLHTAKDHKLITSCVFLGDTMIGFSIDEILPFQYATSHFFKADNSFNGVYDFLNNKVAQYLATQNVTLWNWEQDLGLENLRKSKMSYNPVNFLLKYKVSLTYNK